MSDQPFPEYSRLISEYSVAKQVLRKQVKQKNIFRQVALDFVICKSPNISLKEESVQFLWTYHSLWGLNVSWLTVSLANYFSC